MIVKNNVGTDITTPETRSLPEGILPDGVSITITVPPHNGTWAAQVAREKEDAQNKQLP